MIKIDAKNVDFYYGDFHALKNISMEIEPNTSTAFIGPSGCGKSTFLRLFNRMNDLIPGTRMEGQILIDGRDIYTKSEKVDRLRKNVGMVFQKPNPFPKTIYENVAYGLRVNGVNDENYIEETVVKTLKQVVLWDEVKDKLKESAFALSGGQQQRLCIARALAISPSILLMDEPTNGLDIPGKSQFRKFIASGMSDDKTIVISTHQVRDIDKVLDHVLIMDDSRVLLDESTSNICDKLFFVESDNRELAKNALFAIPTIQGNYLILPNEEQEESELNLELLFNATLAAPEEIARLFHTQK